MLGMFGLTSIIVKMGLKINNVGGSDMAGSVDYLSLTKDAILDVTSITSDIDKIFEKADEQADTRKGAIQTINKLCDALQLACDLILKEISTSIVEFNQLKSGNEDALRGHFERVAIKFSDSSLRLLLHEGRVCGELHALGDRFKQPFSDATRSGTSFWDNVKTFFTRSNTMKHALDGLHEGEIYYLRDLASFLDDLKIRAEGATAITGDIDQLRQAGDELIALMRDKRQTLQDHVREIQDAAKNCVEKLH
jgi:hypothetical protein